jgi:aspartyl-tRNA(Asn)/glutamyl-tRNA(Gln) amidotransferase subunit A
VPADGFISLSWSMDHIAPMGQSVRDVALLTDILCDAPGVYTGGLPGSLAGKKLVYSPATLANASVAVTHMFDAVLSSVQDSGAIIAERDIPSRDDLDLANAAGMIVSRCEAATYHAEIGTNLDLCTDETRIQLQEAQQATAADYLRAMQLRKLLRERIVAAMGDADALVMPTTKVQAPLVEDAGQYLLILSENCIPWSFIDLPAISIPAGMSDGLPLGVQLVGRPGGDAALLALAHGLEQVLPVLPEWRP